MPRNPVPWHPPFSGLFFFSSETYLFSGLQKKAFAAAALTFRKPYQNGSHTPVQSVIHAPVDPRQILQILPLVLIQQLKQAPKALRLPVLQQAEITGHIRVFLPVYGKLFLQKKLAVNGEEYSYVSCDFGLLKNGQPERFRSLLQLLNEDQREYLQDLPWIDRRVYHRLNGRMRAVLIRLSEGESSGGECFFLKTGEKICF